MSIIFYPHQTSAIERLDSGSILCGGVGTGKSMTALGYFYTRECGGFISDRGDVFRMTRPKDLYIITTARKRDTGEWAEECAKFPLDGINVTIDSWNNVAKYVGVKHAFFIFDEQRVVGSGAWAKSFVKIARENRWILLTATPGDTWMDYIPVFIANGFYRNRTEFVRRHCIFNRYSKYPKIDRYVDVAALETYRRRITVAMDFSKATVPHYVDIPVSYDKLLFDTIFRDRWNPYDEEPIRDMAKAVYLIRRAVNSDASRFGAVMNLIHKHDRVIIFYNLDCELEQLRKLAEYIPVSEWNGHKHESIPDSARWAYLVQYTAGAEGWNCILANTIIFYSQNYSYKIMKQAAGRIDRMNTPYTDLYYYTLKSDSMIDKAIARALKNKENFNESTFLFDSGFVKKTRPIMEEDGAF